MSIEKLTQTRIKEHLKEIAKLGVAPPDITGLTPELAVQKLSDFIVAEKARAEAAPPPAIEPPAEEPKQGEYQGHELKEAPTSEQVQKMITDMEARYERQMKEMQNQFAETLRNAAKERGVSENDLAADPRWLKTLERFAGKEGTMKGLVREGYVDPNDRIPPVTFFSNKGGTKLWFRLEAGVKIAPPEGIEFIRFKSLFRFVDPQTLKMQVREYFTTESRAVADFVRKHHKFAVEIFENQQEADKLSDNSDWAEARDRHMVVLKQKLDDEVLRMASDMGIRMNMDMDMGTYRRKIAELLANQEFQQRAVDRAAFIKEREGEELLAKQLLATG